MIGFIRDSAFARTQEVHADVSPTDFQILGFRVFYE